MAGTNDNDASESISSVQSYEPEPLNVAPTVYSDTIETVRDVLEDFSEEEDIPAAYVYKRLPNVVKNFDQRINSDLSELEKLPKVITSAEDAVIVFMQIIGSAKESLRKILLVGEFDEYPDENDMRCTARLAEMLDQFSHDLHKNIENFSTKEFLMEEIKILQEAKLIGIPNSMPRTSFLNLLNKKVKEISSIPGCFIDKALSYIEDVLIYVLMDNSEHYQRFQNAAQLSGQCLIAKMKENSLKHAKEVLAMEKLTYYTCSADYMAEYNKLMGNQDILLSAIFCDQQSRMLLEGIGFIEVDHLRQNMNTAVQQAFELKMRVIAYWKIAVRRLIDSIALYLQFNVNSLVKTDLEKGIVADMLSSPVGGGIERLLKESP